LITQQAIRRGSFRSVRELVQKIDAYVTNYNLYRRPFVWTATANSILEKLQRLGKFINGTSH
ncbi:MAG: IS630 family transposase, partial [Candidatus Binataceae bacterium]